MIRALARAITVPTHAGGAAAALPLPRALRLAVALGIFVAFLGFDLYWVARSLPHPLQDDEWRYLYYAENLLRGYYSPRPRVFLWNGPGYPLLLVPFVKLGWQDGARYANGLWHAAALTYAWLTVSARLPPRWALAAVALLGLYAPVYEFLPLLQTEVFCFFLMAAWIEHAARAPASPWHRFVAAFLLALLCLTKVVFGVVLLGLLALALCAWLRWRGDRVLRAWLQQAALAFVLCLPYLGYTYELTGRPLYWSSAGASSLYWLSSPHADEWGDWYHLGWVERHPTLRAHHQAVMDEASGALRDPSLSSEERLFNLSTPEAGDIFLREASRNVRAHPLKFLRNWCGNVLRLLLDVPSSVRDRRWWNRYSCAHLPLLAWSLLAGALIWRRRLELPAEWKPLAAFLVVSLATHSFSSATARFLVPLVPLWWLGSCCWLGAGSGLKGAFPVGFEVVPRPPEAQPRGDGGDGGDEQ
jgi:hypothetical protein